MNEERHCHTVMLFILFQQAFNITSQQLYSYLFMSSHIMTCNTQLKRINSNDVIEISQHYGFMSHLKCFIISNIQRACLLVLSINFYVFYTVHCMIFASQTHQRHNISMLVSMWYNFIVSNLLCVCCPIIFFFAKPISAKLLQNTLKMGLTSISGP